MRKVLVLMFYLSVYCFGQVYQSDNLLDAGNSTTKSLSANGMFTGVSKDVITTGNYGTLTIFVYSDQNSATGGLRVLWSNDNTTWHDSTTYSIVAGTPLKLTLQPYLKYFKIRYVNGTSPQTKFVLTTIDQIYP